MPPRRGNLASSFPSPRRSVKRRRRLGPLIAALAVTACAEMQPGTSSEPEAAERELAGHAVAMQRTVLEATATGAVLGAAIGALWRDESLEDRLRGAAAGGALGAAAGAAAGSYVAHLQQRYATREAQLERLRADIERTNAETAAAIETMRRVVAQQRRDLAAARESGETEALAAEQRTARSNLQSMAAIIEGAEGRLEEFSSTRALQLVEGEGTGVDAEIAELGGRIAAMRQIAGTLAEEI
jgi:hypothetical protein